MPQLERPETPKIPRVYVSISDADKQEESVCKTIYNVSPAQLWELIERVIAGRDAGDGKRKPSASAV